MPTRPRPPHQSRTVRTAATVLGPMLLGAFLFLQAGSSALGKKSPAISLRLNPFNGLAREELASQKFVSLIKSEADIEPAAQASKSEAIASFRGDPLVPKAYAILAISEPSSAKREAVFAAALQLNKRDALLQGLVLQEALAAEHYPNMLDALDAILRAHPKQQESLFPVLASALSRKVTLPTFAEIYQRPPVAWRENFLNFAAGNKDALPNLAKLRLGLTGDVDPQTDNRIISGLAASGNADLSFQVYRAAGGDVAKPHEASRTLGWEDRFEPFDWKFSDQGNFRAQRELGGGGLELYARPGSGGVIASRMIPSPKGALSIRMNSAVTQQNQNDVRLQVTCFGGEGFLLDEPIGKDHATYMIGSVPSECKFVTISIYARAWTGGSAIRGTLGKLTVATEE